MLDRELAGPLKLFKLQKVLSRKLKRISLIVTINLVSVYFACLTLAQYGYDHHTIDKGVTYDQIEDVVVDKDGVVWLATSTGLHVFDGYNYTAFVHESDNANSISENFVTSLFEDSKGKVWIGTYNNGLNVYSKEYQAITRYTEQDSSKLKLYGDKIPRLQNTIAEDGQGNIWIVTDVGLNKIDVQKQETTLIQQGLIGQILFDENENCLWIANSKLFKYSLANNKLQEIPFSKSPENNFSQVNGGVVDESSLYLATDIGLLIYNKNDRSLSEVVLLKGARNYKLQKSVAAIYKDMNGRLWVSQDKSIFILNKKGVLEKTLSNIGNNENSLLDDNIKGIYGNNNGIILVTYTNRKITSINITQQKFHHVTLQNWLSKDEANNLVRSIYKDSKENFWVGTYNQGLICFYGGDFKQRLTFRHDVNRLTSIPSDYITSIYQSKAGRLWVGTFENGLCFSDNVYSDNIEFARYNPRGRLEVHAFTEDIKGNIWISTNEGFYLFNASENDISYYGNLPLESNKLLDVNIQAVVYEAPNTFLLATWNSGVVKLVVRSKGLVENEREKDSLVIYNNIFDQFGNSITAGFITALKGRDGNYWLGSSGNGLVNMVDGEKPQFKTFKTKDGSPSNIIYGLQIDSNNNIWLSSKEGMGKFNTQTKLFQNYYESDGLPTNSFIWDSQFKDEKGDIYFGGIEGLVYFNPNEISDTKTAFTAYFSGLIINHKKVEIAEWINKHTQLKQDIRYTDSLILTHNESSFSIEFAALNVIHPDEVVFAYKLEGFDEEWINADSKNRVATYTNLKHGTYRFKVRATRNIGYWTGKEAELLIEVYPPWWRTIWAYIGYSGSFLILLYLFQYLILKQSRLTHNLEMEQYKHKRDKELVQDKFRFFTNLTHEFRTPLTLILGPLDKMIKNNEGNSRIHQNLLLMRDQAKRLQKITNQLINFRKYETENLKLKAVEKDVVSFLEEMTLAFKQHARIKEISFNYHSKIDNCKLYFDEDKLEIIIVNILSNAFKFTPNKGEVTLSIEQQTGLDFNASKERISRKPHAFVSNLPEKNQSLVMLKIEDSGCGIEANQLEHIFKRYYQASNTQGVSFEGSGIGMEMTKNFIELHRGAISVTSEQNRGTSFYIWLPIGKNHLTESELTEENRTYEDSILVDDNFNIEQQKSKKVKTDSENANLPSLLLVDDNQNILNFLNDTFCEKYDVTTALDGREGIEKAIEIIPDVIISDIMMPEIDGLELCRTLKSDQRTSHVPIILLTARSSSVFQAEGFATGADAYIAKPFDVNLLTVRVDNLYRSRKKLSQRYSSEINLKPKDISITDPDEKFLEKLIGIVEDNISEPNLKVEDISKEMAMSHSVLYKKVVALTDLTVVEFIRTIKLKRAASILKQTNIPINEVSFSVGFTDPKYFSKCFQKFYGSTPTSYKQTKADGKTGK